MRKFLIPLREAILFPDSLLPLIIARKFSKNAFYKGLKEDGELVFVTQKNASIESPQKEDLYEIGCIGKIIQHIETSEGMIRCVAHGIKRVKIKEIIKEGADDFYFVAEYEEYPFLPCDKKDEEFYIKMIKEVFKELLKIEKIVPDELLPSLLVTDNKLEIAFIIASNLPVHIEKKQKLLEEKEILGFLKGLHKILLEELEFRKLKEEIEEKVREEIRKGQKQVFLAEQMRQIQKELGYEEPDEFTQYMEAIKKAGMPKDVEEKARHELQRLMKTPAFSPEATVIRTYLDWLINLPWNKRTKDNLDLKNVKRILDEDHYGLEEPKSRILEYLAILKLKGKLRGQILCFVGPPGVGKTSLARSIARSLGRSFVRMSLGGIRDEAEIRGHRRTYVGALPGRIIQGIRKAGSKNPVFLLDEIDKVGMDFRGDPYAALMEVLDPEVNKHFQDNYLETEFDLSEVLFITTANTIYTIPLALRDRMEIIRLPGYLDVEKFHIAKKHLIQKLLKEAGLEDKYFRISDKAIYEIIKNYTREAGVRELERRLNKLVRIAAKNYVEKNKKTYITLKNITSYLGPEVYIKKESDKNLPPGVVYGLAWTETGGEILRVEVLNLEGKGNLILTGKLGDVLQESAKAALSYIRSRAKWLGIDEKFYEKRDLHLHIPEGSIPKDGPSAGLAIICAMISSLLNCSFPSDVALTGEITLTGEVIKIGGVPEKISAAKRAGIKRVIMPEENRSEIEKMKPSLKEGLKFTFVKHVDEVIKDLFNIRYIEKEYKGEIEAIHSS
ncbi:MAG: endopeptidase La [candidate division WOR-3 bacterium]|uniref:Lon protease n=2 Tax=candidate division WOR-3 bacterium TaxID=2052148 RepID=A0A7V3ZTN5_UNCW3